MLYQEAHVLVGEEDLMPTCRYWCYNRDSLMGVVPFSNNTENPIVLFNFIISPEFAIFISFAGMYK